MARAKKRLGQHFLHDANIARKIVRLAGLGAGDEVFEIGPGEGALTAFLLDAGARVTAVEADAALVPRLRQRFADRPAGDLTLHEGDFLRLVDAPVSPFGAGPYAVISNIPYNITTPIIFALIRRAERFPRAVLMVQEEVARRLTAMPGSGDYGRLSIMASLFCDIDPGFPVSPACFRPPPRVWSRVIALKLQREPRHPVSDPKWFAAVVAALFAQRRKQIVNPLLGLLGGRVGRTELTACLRTGGFRPDCRPGELSPADLCRLADLLAGCR
ncbi:MAG: ribosomal RNA small subunit methyltransferase A [Deltaproteobacteria bacterium]|nr:ribosomal RNA small subunit methyltransferase A [Candidatus Anaeroferrophillacea bacterium]